MYERDTILSLKTPKWRPVVDGEPGDWTEEGYEEFVTEYDEFLAANLAHVNDPRKVKAPEHPEGELFPYNEVKVVGESPIGGIPRGDYTGPDASGVIITPTASFGATLDEPFGKLRALYDVKELPAPKVVNPMATRNPLAAMELTGTGGVDQDEYATRRVNGAGVSPEEVFQREAPGVPPEAGQIRGRTPITDALDKSPLTAPAQSKSSSPLDA